MREIKFRGKAISPVQELDDNDIPNKNRWLQGGLVVNDESIYITGDIIEASEDGLIHNWWAQVEPDSVGQYTGLKDKNGVDIYEGDVVTFNDFDSLRTGGLTSDCIITGEVVFAYGMWIVKSNDNEHDLYQALINDEELKVICSIFDKGQENA